MTSYYDVTEDELKKILKKYNTHCDDTLNDYHTIIKRAVVDTTWNDVLFEFTYGNIILNIDDLSYKEGQPNTNTITENILSQEESKKLNDEYINTKIDSITEYKEEIGL